MYDINFFKKSSEIKKKITNRLLSKKEADDISAELDLLRDKIPHIYNIETTNYCNMKCVMCPRTMFMTRSKASFDKYNLLLHTNTCHHEQCVSGAHVQ